MQPEKFGSHKMVVLAAMYVTLLLKTFFHFPLELKFPKLSSIYSLVWLNLCIITSIC